VDTSTATICRAFILRASPKYEARTIPRARDEGDGGLFYGSENLWLQNSAILRKAALINLRGHHSEKHTAQRREKLRKCFSLNYKSAALTS
jgi:hypothetical protein